MTIPRVTIKDPFSDPCARGPCEVKYAPRVRILLSHRSSYRYRTPATLSPHTVRLHPAPHTRARVETYRLIVEPAHRLRWSQDPVGNRVARLDFLDGEKTQCLDVRVELAIDVNSVNPFDFLLEPLAEKSPFAYPAALAREVAPFVALDDPAYAGGALLDAFDRELPRSGDTIQLCAAINSAVNARVRYIIREEAGVFTPEVCLTQGRASCRDSAVLLSALLRRRGLATRFVSGYLVQLADEGMLPDQPKGMSKDVVDLHAWCEVYLPGAGWIGLDATSGLFCGEGHVPLCCASSPQMAAPLEGASDVLATGVTFEMSVRRLGHEARPTAPYTPEVWDALRHAGTAVDARLEELKVVLTMGGEPTFNAREDVDAPEWNGAALGPHKWKKGVLLAAELRNRLMPGAVTLHRIGKWYPGESLPRWALDLIGRRDKKPMWSDSVTLPSSATRADAQRFIEALAKRLGTSAGLHEAYEDPWELLKDETRFAVELDAMRATLDDPEARQRLARHLSQGVTTVAGWVLPLMPDPDGPGWQSSRWEFRRGALYLLPGDGPVGLRLPLRSLTEGIAPQEPEEREVSPPDPRREQQLKDRLRRSARAAKPNAVMVPGVRTALAIEERKGRLWVFLPPLPDFARFAELVRIIDETRAETRLDVALEGYPAERSPEHVSMSVTPDPGVLEVNLPPVRSMAELEPLIVTVFDAALHAGLHAEKYLVDGRMAGSGGGNHITMGGPTALESPFVKNTALVASLLTFVQHHPSLSYLFAGLFVGPTSQAPRVDEARHDSLYELEIALARAFKPDPGGDPPWMADLLFRHLLTDLTGNTHRAEISIDKLFDPQTPHGRQGLVELRAFEMPPHPRMVYAQTLLARAIVTHLSAKPYQHELVRWGMGLHDRFLLPHFMWADLVDVLAQLRDVGLPLEDEAYRPFLELRCPLVGTMYASDVTIDVRNAIEPWNVLGEEQTAGGTSRYVDSSMERIEVRASGLVPGRHAVVVNGHQLPMHAIGAVGTYVAGVRFRAWAPPHSLQPHIGTHHPIRIDVVDTWGQRSLGGCAYHVWHPEGRAFDAPPLTRFEAAARRAQRFTLDGPMPWPVRIVPAAAHRDAPITLDLRRFALDKPPEWPKKITLAGETR